MYKAGYFLIPFVYLLAFNYSGKKLIEKLFNYFNVQWIPLNLTEA